MSKPTYTSFSLYLNDELKIQLVKLADGRQLSTFISRILADYVAPRSEPKNNTTGSI